MTIKTDSGTLAKIKGFLRQSSGFAGKTVEGIRRDMEQSAAGRPALPGIRIEKVQEASWCGEWLRPERQDDCGLGQCGLEQAGSKVILYIHGGGFVAGTCEFYRDLASRIALAGAADVLSVEYRLAPEHPYPAANEDVMEAYRWLLDSGYSPGNIVIGGDSVGATLALMTLLSLRDSDEPLPGGAFLMSPHADLVNLDGESYTSCAALDPTGSREGNAQLVKAYWGDRAEQPPALFSPLRMELSGLPPLLVQVGGHEVLLSDAIRLADRAKEAGVQVELQIWENMWCVFQMLAYMLPEAQNAILHIGRFVRETGTVPQV